MSCVTSIWTKYTLLAIPGSFVFTMGFLPLYAWIAPMLGFSLEYTNVVGRLWSSLVFWLTIFGLPFLLLTRDFAWKSQVAPPRPPSFQPFALTWIAWFSRYKRLFRPEPYHIVQEIQKYNLPDYRPRMEQFQKVRLSRRAGGPNPRKLLGFKSRSSCSPFDILLAGDQKGPRRAAIATEQRFRVLPVRVFFFLFLPQLGSRPSGN